MRCVPLPRMPFREGAMTKAAMKSEKNLQNLVIVVKGAGEMASGVVHRLYKAGMRKIAMLEIPRPLCVRRFVSFCEAVFDGKMTVEGITAQLVASGDEIPLVWEKGSIAVMVDPRWQSIAQLHPDVVIDAVMAKRNLGTTRNEAPLVIGIGPGFNAPGDVHLVVESNRGHDIGRVIFDGSAEPYTGIPGQMMNFSKERVLRAPVAGKVSHYRVIGDNVKKGDHILSVGDTPVYAPIDGILRGLIREIDVTTGEKVGDVDPRAKPEFCRTISDKARAISGGVLEAIMQVYNNG